MKPFDIILIPIFKDRFNTISPCSPIGDGRGIVHKLLGIHIIVIHRFFIEWIIIKKINMNVIHFAVTVVISKKNITLSHLF